MVHQKYSSTSTYHLVKAAGGKAPDCPSTHLSPGPDEPKVGLTMKVSQQIYREQMVLLKSPNVCWWLNSTMCHSVSSLLLVKSLYITIHIMRLTMFQHCFASNHHFGWSNTHSRPAMITAKRTAARRLQSTRKTSRADGWSLWGGYIPLGVI